MTHTNGMAAKPLALQLGICLLVTGMFAYGQETSSAQGMRLAALDWGLQLPAHPVSRRLSRAFGFRGPEPQVLGELQGPGCIRRIWVTGNNLGRQVVLRIYFDGESVPYVEAPLGDFFGAMHNLMASPFPHSHTRTDLPDDAYRINTPWLTVNPKNAFTCCFPMPFSQSARIEVVGSEVGSFLYYLIDWHDYPGQQLMEPMRFCARWRREAPVPDYKDDYLILDADGPGRLVGFIYSINMLQSRHQMRWSHAGADNIYIDGDGLEPAFMRGIGGEDTFGTSFGGGDYLPGTALFADMPYYIQKDPEGDKQKLVAYRFFFHDAITFDRSIHFRFGARSHDIASTVYWYSSKPVRPFFTVPPVEKRMPGSELRREYDLPLPDAGTWWTAGPFPQLPERLPLASEFDSAVLFQGRPWRRFSALRGFVEFNHVYRPGPSNNNSPILTGAALACCVLESPRATKAQFTLAWDDQLLLQVNDGTTIDLGSQAYLRARTVEQPLKKGKNIVALGLSNTMGLTRGAWNFSFRAVTAEGEELLPLALGEPGPEPTAWRVEPNVLLAHWRLNETGGRIAGDATGNGHDAVLAPGMTDANWVPGRLSGAVRLNGNDQYLQVSGPLAWADFDRLPFSLAAWVRTTDPDVGAVIYRKDFSGNPKFELDVAGGQPRFRIRNRSGAEFRCDSDGSSIADGNWHHVAAVKGPDSMFLHVDGKRVASAPLPEDAGSFTTDSPAFWHIGSCVTGMGSSLMNFFAGEINDVRIYSYALDAISVARLTATGGGERSAASPLDQHVEGTY